MGVSIIRQRPVPRRKLLLCHGHQYGFIMTKGGALCITLGGWRGRSLPVIPDLAYRLKAEASSTRKQRKRPLCMSLETFPIIELNRSENQPKISVLGEPLLN